MRISCLSQRPHHSSFQKRDSCGLKKFKCNVPKKRLHPEVQSFDVYSLIIGKASIPWFLRMSFQSIPFEPFGMSSSMLSMQAMIPFCARRSLRARAERVPTNEQSLSPKINTSSKEAGIFSAGQTTNSSTSHQALEGLMLKGSLDHF